VPFIGRGFPFQSFRLTKSRTVAFGEEPFAQTFDFQVTKLKTFFPENLFDEAQSRIDGIELGTGRGEGEAQIRKFGTLRLGEIMVERQFIFSPARREELIGVKMDL